MSNFCIIMGDSGSGKSTSIKSLDPKETIIMNVLGKRLPFKGSKSMYNSEKKNIFAVSDWKTLITYIESISKNKKNIKNIIIDDATYVMRTEFFNRSEERGFDKFNELADHFRKLIATCSAMRDDLNIFMMLHIEPIEADDKIVSYKCSSVGKLLDKMYNPVESVAVVLFCKPKFDDKGVPTYGFWTHKKVVTGIELPCKTPDGMFEEDFIPNDLGIVIKAMNEYYD
jgi:hypothetical protein